MGLFILLNNLATHIRNECLWYADALLCLEVLEDRGNDTWESESRTVESVAKLCLLCLGVAVTALQAVCLICVEVRN